MHGLDEAERRLEGGRHDGAERVDGGVPQRCDHDAGDHEGQQHGDGVGQQGLGEPAGAAQLGFRGGWGGGGGHAVSSIPAIRWPSSYWS